MAVVQTLIGNVKGPQGETGATGPQGAQGEAATINVGTVSTTAYGNAAQVTNVGTENDAVFNFVIPQGKPGERTTTMGGLTLDTITTQTADYPVPAVGDTGATVFGKIVKWFSDALAAITDKLDKANVVNNLTTTAEGYALDARQGKALNDSLAWKLLTGNLSGTASQSLTGITFRELYVRTSITVSGTTYCFLFMLLKNELGSSNKNYCGGLANGNNSSCRIAASLSSVNLNEVYLNGTAYTSNANTAVFYR